MKSLKNKHWLVALATFFIALMTFGIGTTAQAAGKIADVSQWNGTINWARAKNELEMAIIKVQGGTTNPDPMASYNASQANKYGIPFGSYAYCYATSTSDARTEARNFYNRSNKKSRFYVVDVEENTSYSGESMRAITKSYVKEFNKLTSKKIGVYSGKYFYTSHSLGGVGQDFNWIADYPYDPGFGELHQYTSTGTVSGIPTGVDLSVKRGVKASYFIGTSKAAANAKKYTAGGFKVGQTVKLAKRATKFQAPQVNIAPSVKGKSYKILQTKSVKQSHSKQAVLLSGINSWVLSQDVDRYLSYNPKLVKITNPAAIHSDVNGGKTVKKLAKGTFVKTAALTKTDKGTPRLQVAGGYLTANRAYVLNGYYVSVPKSVTTLKPIYQYKDTGFKQKAGIVHKGSNLKVVANSKSSNGTWRLQLINGHFITANKQFVKQ